MVHRNYHNGLKTTLLLGGMWALLLAIAVCALAGANLFAAIGLPIGPHMVGCVLTGVLVSRGSNFLHDLLGKVQP